MWDGQKRNRLFGKRNRLYRERFKKGTGWELKKGTGWEWGV